MNKPDYILNAYGRARLDDRAVNELVGFARGLIADDQLVPQEVEALEAWLAANHSVSRNPLVAILLKRVQEIMADGVVDDDERAELFEVLGSGLITRI